MLRVLGGLLGIRLCGCWRLDLAEIFKNTCRRPLCVCFFFFFKKGGRHVYIRLVHEKYPWNLFSPRRRASPTSKDNHSELIKARILFGY